MRDSEIDGFGGRLSPTMTASANARSLNAACNPRLFSKAICTAVSAVRLRARSLSTTARDDAASSAVFSATTSLFIS
ncbi:MAG: hypothetical protein NVV83_22650 [Afipia sp.]|nr:hypothetical protein [Afipia sp.]